MKRLLINFFLNKTILLLVLTTSLLISLYIDIAVSEVAPSDIRNRMVGGRIMKDGSSPYFYLWHPGEPIRYYDYIKGDAPNVSLSTSTPFFHWIVQPIADFPQYKLNLLWFWFNYFSLALCTMLAALSYTGPPNKYLHWVLAALAIFFTYTIGWRNHLAVGQNYILIPVAAMACLYCIKQKSNLLHWLLFGAFACSTVLLRPIAALLFFPLLFYFKAYYKWLLSAAALMIAYAIFVISNPVQKTNWIEYFESVKVHTANHQKTILQPTAIINTSDVIHQYEGIDVDTRGSEEQADKLRKGLENSNFFIFYSGFTGKKMSVTGMTILGLGCCFVLLLPLLFIRKKKIDISVEALLLLGFLLYNIYEFFTPVHRANYHFVQLIFPVLVSALFIKRFYIIPVLLLLFGLYLNCVIWPSIKMEHNMGEMLMVAVWAYLIYRPLLAKNRLTSGGKKLIWV